MALDPVAPRSFNRDPDADPRPRGDSSDRDPSVFDGQFTRGEIETVVLDRDAKGLRQVARTSAECVVVYVAAVRRATLPHQVETVKRL